MKTGAPVRVESPPIVGLYGATTPGAAAAGQAELERARTFAEPLLAGQRLDTGEDAFLHASGVAHVLADIGAAPAVQAAAFLIYAGDYLTRPEEVVAKAFGASYAGLVGTTRKLVNAQRAVRLDQLEGERQAEQLERVRKMLLAFSTDLRVVLLRLASRLRTLRYFTSAPDPCPPILTREALQVFAPLASRLGIWQIKWEMEDLAFRFQHPAEYHQVARLLDERRIEREHAVEQARRQVAELLAANGIGADVQGRPKHLYSIWKKMRGKQLDFEHVFDVRALRVIVDDVPACYAALACVQERFTPITEQFDDYIARPKANGYQSLHCVVRLDDGRSVEVQIRTRAMHDYAEYGVAAHWAYKEAGARGYAGAATASDQELRIAEARKAVLRQLLAWGRDVAENDDATRGAAAAQVEAFDDRIYVFTPQATIIELPAGGTPIDFAYHVHTELGHRCRGARVDGVMVPLNTPLKTAQTVEIVSAKEGGPSRDWINTELGFLKSARSRAKVRAWFNLQAQAQTIARGRELVEKLLQREGRTGVKLELVAEQLGFRHADRLFEVVGKDEFSLRHIEQLLRPSAPAPSVDDAPPLQRPRAPSDRGGVLVVGVGSLLTSLARCCRPAPPDAIRGFVTRDKGVAIHRRDCSNFHHMARISPGRVIDVAWDATRSETPARYPLDVEVDATERPGLLRDITEEFSRQRMNVTDVQSRTVNSGDGRLLRMVFTVETADTSQLAQVLLQVLRVPAVRHARRR